jgi:hypothetical protein
MSLEDPDPVRESGSDPGKLNLSYSKEKKLRSSMSEEPERPLYGFKKTYRYMTGFDEKFSQLYRYPRFFYKFCHKTS